MPDGTVPYAFRSKAAGESPHTEEVLRALQGHDRVATQ